MKCELRLLAITMLFCFPMMCEGKTIAYSPSNQGQPLIFHFETNETDPGQFSAVAWAQLQNALLIRSSYSDHLDNRFDRCCQSQCNVWVEGVGQWQHQNSGHQDLCGYNDITGGVTVGTDISSGDFLVGAAFSYTNTKLRWEKSRGESRINSYYGGLYGSWNQGCYYIDGFLLGALINYHTTRNSHLGTVESQGRSHHNGGELLTGIEAGILFEEAFCAVDCVPFVGFDYLYLSQQGYSEKGTSQYNVTVKRRNDQLLQSQLGVQLTRRILYEFCCESWTVAPNLAFSYINQTPLTGRSYRTHFVGSDPGFSVDGWSFERNLGAISLGLNLLNCSETLNFSIDYNGQFGKNYWNQTGSISCNLYF